MDLGKLERLLQRARRERPAGVYRQAAVFVLLSRETPSRLLLIQRADRGDPWANHIAFPGGHIEPGDASPLDAAYRETFEEVGVTRREITYVADLGHFQTQTQQVNLRAYLGLWDGAEELNIAPTEVAEAMLIPAAALGEQHRERGFEGMPAAELGDHLEYRWRKRRIWGVTARILHHIFTAAGPAFTPAPDGGDSFRRTSS